MYYIFIFFIVIVVALIKFFDKQILGWFGEHWTKQVLRKLPKNKYKIINDVFIKVNGYTHQIDHVVVSEYGIFCIETKQYNGFIVGKKWDKQWTRYVGKNKYPYENPIRQNYGHVKALSELLNIDEKKIFNIVCIPSNAKLRIEHDGELVRNYTLKDKILSYKDRIIDNVYELIDIINNNNIKDKELKKEHVENIRKNIINNNINRCPKCGGTLVKRNGQYGEFIGCSNYPRCKYTRNK